MRLSFRSMIFLGLPLLIMLTATFIRAEESPASDLPGEILKKKR